MDHFLGIRGKSDPYAKVSIGLQHFRSQTIYKNLNPTWNEVFEVRVSSAVADVLQVPCGVMLGVDRGGPHTPKEQHREVVLGGRQIDECNSHVHIHQVSRGGLLCPVGRTAYKRIHTSPPLPPSAGISFLGSFQSKRT